MEKHFLTILEYIKARLGETSTWVSFGAGAAGAAALASPWSYIAMACAMIGALVPTTSKNDDHHEDHNKDC